jgi:hypothetical protein
VMSVFVEAVRVEGPDGLVRLNESFDTSAAGLEPRTHEHAGHIVFHPATRAKVPTSPAPPVD